MPPADHPRLDTSRPSVARVYDVFLGGKDNFEVDREVYRRAMEINPDAQLFAVEMRRWLVRAVRYLAAEAGIDQFLDCGSGLPTAENTHQVAQRINPEATVVYVDNDPAVIVHGRALLEDNEHTHVVAADLRKPHDLLNHPDILRHLDMNRPLALMQCSTIHHVEDHERPREIMAAYIDALPSGSYVALTHFFDPEDDGPLSAMARELEHNLVNSVGSGRCRTRAEIAAFLDGLEPVEPGMGRLVDWRPDCPLPDPVPDVHELGIGVLARKP